MSPALDPELHSLFADLKEVGATIRFMVDDVPSSPHFWKMYFRPKNLDRDLIRRIVENRVAVMFVMAPDGDQDSSRHGAVLRAGWSINHPATCVGCRQETLIRDPLNTPRHPWCG